MPSRIPKLAEPLILLLQLAAILTVGWRFSRRIVSFSTSVTPTGREYDGVATWIGLGRDDLIHKLELPLWNHFWGSGLPYLGDPFSHFFSPLALASALLVGGTNGPRLTMALTIACAGLAQLFLARGIGLSFLPALFAALVYMMNGHMMARFDYGHYDFGLAFAFLPLCYGLLIRTLRGAGALLPLLAGVAIAFLLLSGNFYYFAFTIPGLVITTLIYAVHFNDRRFRLNLGVVRRAALVAVWALGLSAIQWLPWLSSRNLVAKDPDRLLMGSISVWGTLTTLFHKDAAYYQTSAHGMTAGYLHEYYSYVGVIVVILLLLSPLALLTGRYRRPFLVLTILFLVYLFWASAAHTPFRYLYQAVPRLYDFRWTSRQFGLAMPMVAGLSGLALESLWDLHRRILAHLLSPGRRHAIALASLPVLVCLVAVGVLALRDVYRSNRTFVHYAPVRGDFLALQKFLAADGDRPYSFNMTDIPWGTPSVLRLPMVKLDDPAWGWHLRAAPIRITPTTPPVVLRAAPRYVVSFAGPPPNRPDAKLAATVGSQKVYRLEDAPPYAGFVTRSDAALRPAAFDIAPGGQWSPWPWTKIQPATATWPTANRITVSGEPAPGEDILVVLESYVPGWRLRVDGQAMPVLDIGGLIGAKSVPGDHQYRFVFAPSYAWIGSAITALTLAMAFATVIQGQLSHLLRLPRLPVREFGLQITSPWRALSKRTRILLAIGGASAISLCLLLLYLQSGQSPGTESPASVSAPVESVADRNRVRISDLQAIAAGLEAYHAKEGLYPATNGALQTLCTYASIDTGCQLVGVMGTIPSDPKGKNFGYFYASDGSVYVLVATLEGNGKPPAQYKCPDTVAANGKQARVCLTGP